MLACVCQPADTGIFRRSPVPLGAPPLRLNHKGAIPKPGRTLPLPVITNAPSASTREPSKGNIAASPKKKCDQSAARVKLNNSSNSLIKVSGASGCSKDSAGASGNLEGDDKKFGRKLNDFEKLPDGVQLTLSELREMACRQQAQIDSQHQLLAAKEQRLRYLKEQEARQQRVQAESERLRRLRDRVDAQELKLRKLRAIRGQVDHQKQNNLSLTSDLDSIRALFNEKEKELSLAVAKVEELTRQLEELRRGRSTRDQPPASALELDKLRRELMYRNKLNEQQNQRLNQQREALTARQEEMSAIDKRISELQERLHRKRLLNQQLANQISATSHKAAYHQLVRLTGSTDQGNQGYPRKPQHAASHPPNGLARTNIAAVEPYNHVPLPSGQQNRNNHTTNQENSTYHSYPQNHHIKNEPERPPHPQDNQELSGKQYSANSKSEDNDVLKDFAVSKSDPKYQTLPYNTKFTVNIVPSRGSVKIADDNNVNSSDAKDPEANHHVPSHVNGSVQSHMTVHSAPLNAINKNIATPLNQTDLINRKVTTDVGGKEQQILEVRTNFQNGLRTSENNNGTISALNNANIPYQKPISSVAPTSVHSSGKFSNIYQTSSIKIQPVEPQTLSGDHTKQLPSTNSPQALALSPPQSTSTPMNTPETSMDKTKPALPPKPAIKPPPRQTQIINEDNSQPPPIPSTEPPDDKLPPQQQPKPQPNQMLNKPPILPQSGTNQKTYPSNNQHQQQQQIPPSSTISNSIGQASNNGDNMPIIKAKPLTIKKQPLSEQPKLRTLSSYSKLNGLALSSRRIEMPPTFNFAEVEKVPDANEESVKDKSSDDTDKSSVEEADVKDKDLKDTKPITEGVVRRCKKGNLKQTGKANLSRRVSFDPLALLLDASLEGELELVKKTATQVTNPSAANDEGITALHNAICAGHLEIVKFLVEFGCDVNAQDSDGWTPLHCAASCNNVSMVRFLVEHGACIFATTLSDHETAAEKCEEDEEGFDGCSEYLYSVQEKLGILSGGIVYAVFDYSAQQPDELSFTAGQQLTVLRKGDESEREWWWSRLGDKEGYVPRNLLGLYPRVSRSED